MGIIAAAFYFVAEEVMDGFTELDEQSVVENAKIIPAIEDMVFACEVAHKSFLPAGTSGHRLRELYDQIDPSNQ